MEHQSISLADQVFDVLERDILTGEFAQGEILTESRLSEKLGVSRTPIREALKRLTMEHIIEMTAKGARVIGITRKDIADIYAIRLRTEGTAAAMAAQNMTDSALEELRSTLELQEFYTQRRDPEGIKNMDSRFHQIIYENCGSTIFHDMLEPLHRKIIKYRRVSISIPSRAERSLAEHRGIYEALAARDAKKAETLMVTHIANAGEGILSMQASEA